MKNRTGAVIGGLAVLLAGPALAVENIAPLTGVAGKAVQLLLKASPGTGYTWMVAGLPSQLMLVSGEYQRPADCQGKTGCAGKQVFTFVGTHAGEGTLKLVYGRAFDPSTWEEKAVPVLIK